MLLIQYLAPILLFFQNSSLRNINGSVVQLENALSSGRFAWDVSLNVLGGACNHYYFSLLLLQSNATVFDCLTQLARSAGWVFCL